MNLDLSGVSPTCREAILRAIRDTATQNHNQIQGDLSHWPASATSSEIPTAAQEMLDWAKAAQDIARQANAEL